MPEGKESKKMKIYLEKKTVKENFPNLVKEIDMQVQEAHRVPDKMNARRPRPKHSIIKTPKVKNKERTLKAAREKQLTYRGVPIRLQLISQKKLCRLEVIGKKYLKS